MATEGTSKHAHLHSESQNKGILSIVIVGGGLAGLLAAIRLARDGHSVQVFERRKTLSDRGGGLMIRPNGTRHLDAWDLTAKFETVARPSTKSAMRSLSTGEIISEQVMETYSKYPNWVLTRQGAQKVLFDEAQQTTGVVIKFEVDVVDVRENPCAAVLKDGSVVHADLVIVADGVRSRLREHVLGGHDESLEPVVNGLITYQTNMPLESTRKSHELSSLLSSEGTVNVWSDKGRHVVSGSGTDVYMADFIVNESGQGTSEDKSKSLWDETGDIKHVREVYHNVAPQLQAWLSKVDKCSRWTLCYLPDLPKWRSKHGTVILLGDAAHAMLPSAAQGLSQIIEDIAALSYLLRPAATPAMGEHSAKTSSCLPLPLGQVSRALARCGRGNFKSQGETSSTTGALSSIADVTKIWQDFRIPRLHKIKVLAGSTQTKFQSKPDEKPDSSKAPPHSSSQGVGHSSKDVQPDMHAEFTSPAFQKWEFDYDLIEELKRFLEEL